MSTRVYGSRGWVKTCSSSSNQASIASQSRRIRSRSSSIGEFSYRRAAPGTSSLPALMVSARPSPRLGECVDRAVRGEKLGAHVGEREVVGRVVGNLPHQHRAGGVGHDLAAEVGADALRAGFDPDSPVRSVRSSCNGGHFVPLSLCRPFTLEDFGFVRSRVPAPCI